MPPDAAHADAQAAFHAALWRDGPPPGLAAPSTAEVARRFAVYRNNVHRSLSRALAARFPVVERLVGEAFFAAMARVFIAAHPPADPVLLQWGGSFPVFVSAFEPVAGLPWLVDVARLELARGRACHAADAAPLPPDALAVSDPETLRLRLHPSVELFASAHPAVGIWQSHQSDEAPKHKIGAGASHALIGRDPDFAVVVEAVDADTHAVLAALAAGQPLGQAATATDPTPALALLLRHGLITAIDTGAPT